MVAPATETNQRQAGAESEPLPVQIAAAFRFLVKIGGESQAAFTECTLPVVEWEVEEVKEGGVNSFVRQLPGRRKPARLTLKYGVAKTALYEWCREALNGKISPKNVTITLYDYRVTGGQRQPVMVWEIQGAFPVKWTGPDLKTDSSTIAMQTLELACGEVTVG